MAGSYLVVETTNKCSLACVHCSVSEVGHPHHQAVGYIDPDLVTGLFEDLVRVGAWFDTLILFWLGEPLIHPYFREMYQAAIRANQGQPVFGKIELHSNATHLDLRNARVLLNQAPVRQVMHFSLDAAGRETYLLIKGKDRFDRVEANVARFIAEKGRLGARWPRPVFQFIVSDKNRHQAERFRDRWLASCRRAGLPARAAAQNVPDGEDAIVFFRQLDCPTAQEQARQNGVFRELMAELGLSVNRQEKAPETVEAANLTPCSGFWKSPVIAWNGEVTVCTRDNLLMNSLGNLADHNFSDLWWGRDLAQRRQRVSQGDYSGMTLCQTCFIPRSSNYTDVRASEIAAHRTWEQTHFSSGPTSGEAA
jgi:hypothetical protein